MKDKEKKWSIISNLAIITSLIFVIYELRLNHEALVEANLIGRMESSNHAYTGSSLMRQMVIDNAEVWNKACKGLTLTEEETLIRKMISITWYFNHGQMYEQAVHLKDGILIKSRISQPERIVPIFPAIKADWPDVKAEFISKGYEALVEPYQKAFRKLDNLNKSEENPLIK